ncbi:MAG: hypothetical protein DIU78_007105 [Pseudomonadota bacterium]
MTREERDNLPPNGRVIREECDNLPPSGRVTRGDGHRPAVFRAELIRPIAATFSSGRRVTRVDGRKAAVFRADVIPPQRSKLCRPAGGAPVDAHLPHLAL